MIVILSYFSSEETIYEILKKSIFSKNFKAAMPVDSPKIRDK